MLSQRVYNSSEVHFGNNLGGSYFDKIRFYQSYLRSQTFTEHPKNTLRVKLTRDYLLKGAPNFSAFECVLMLHAIVSLGEEVIG